MTTNSTPKHVSKRYEYMYQKELFKNFIEQFASFVIVPNWKQLKYPPIGEKQIVVLYIYMIE